MKFNKDTIQGLSLLLTIGLLYWQMYPMLVYIILGANAVIQLFWPK